MSSFFVFDHRENPALPLHGGADGHPDKFVYWQDMTSSGGPMKIEEKFTGRNVCRIPNDDGAAWTIQDLGGTTEDARGAFLYLEVVGEVNMVEVNQRFQRALANKKRVLEGAGVNVEYVPGPIIKPKEEEAAEDKPSDAADTDMDGTVSKAERKKWNRDHPEDQR